MVEDEEGVVSVAGGCCRVVPRGQPGFSFQDSGAGLCDRVDEFPAPSEDKMRCVMRRIEVRGDKVKGEGEERGICLCQRTFCVIARLCLRRGLSRYCASSFGV